MPRTSTTPRLHYQVENAQTDATAERPRVLLIMGYGMRGEIWQPQIDGLKERCQVAYFDNRGIGKSEGAGDMLTMEIMASDAIRVLDDLRWHERVHVVAVSMGGMIAQELALRWPERLASLTLIATHAGGRSAFLPTARGIHRFLAMRLSPPKKQRAALEKLLFPRTYLASCDRDALRERIRFQTDPVPDKRTISRQLRAIAKHDTRRRLPAMQIPTLIVKPEEDILVRPAHSDKLMKWIPNAKLFRLADAGHGLIYQCARELNERIQEHVLEHENGTSAR